LLKFNYKYSFYFDITHYSLKCIRTAPRLNREGLELKSRNVLDVKPANTP